MAKTLSSEERLINQVAKYSKVRLKNNPLYLGGTKKQGFFNWNRDESALRTEVQSAIDSIYQEVTDDIMEFTRDIMTDIRSSLSSLPLESFDHKQLTIIADYVSDVNRELYHLSIEKEKIDLSDPDHSAQKTLKIYKEALISIEDILHDVEKEDVFSANAYAEIINDLDLNAIHENDVALARAFSFIGSPLKFENGQWEYDESAAKKSPNGLKFQDAFGKDAVYKLPEANVKAFVDGYLNKSVAERNSKVISPSGLFRFYAESIGNSSINLSKLDQSKIDALVEEAKLEFSTDNTVWQSYLVADEISARRDATRLALADVFEEQFSGKEIENSEVYSRELQQSIDEDINGRTLDRLEDMATNVYKKQVASREDNRFGTSSFEEIVDKYQAEYAKLSRELAVAGDRKDVIQARIDEITKSTATLIAIREMQKDLVENVLAEYVQASDHTATANDQNRLALIEKTFKDLGTMDFVNVVDQNGRWNVEIDEDKIPDEYRYHVTKSHYDIKQKINNTINAKIYNDFDVNYELSDEEELMLTTEEIYDCIFNSNLGNEPTLSQVLADEAIMDRTVALFRGPDNAFQRTYLDYFNKTDNPSIEGLVAKLNELGEDLDNFAFTKESLARLRDERLHQSQKNEAIKRYVIMYRMGNALNNNVDLLKALRENGLQANNPMLTKLYQREMDNYKDNPPSDLEIERAKKLFENLNKKKDYERINNYPLKDGEPPVSLIDEFIKDPVMKQILRDREKFVNQEYQKDVEEERQNRLAGNDIDEEIEKEKEEKLKPYKFKDKHGKNDGSDTLKKLKPYCKKSSEKIIDDLLKMIDNTIITPQPKTSSGNNHLSQEYDIQNDPIRNVEIDSEPAKHSEPQKEDPINIPEFKKEPGSIDQDNLEKLQAEIEKRGKYAYLVSGRILNKSISDKNIEWKNADMAPNESELTSIKSLISVLDYIGSPDQTIEDAKMKLALLDLIEARSNNKTEEIKAKNANIEALIGQINSEQLKFAIEDVVTTPDDIHFVWALELSSELSSDGNSSKLKLGSKLDPATIQQIKENPKFVDHILQNGGYFDKQIVEEASKIWAADAVYLEKKEATIDDLLSRMAIKNPNMQDQIDEARAWNSTVNQHSRGEEPKFEDNLIKHQMLNDAVKEGKITEEQANEYRKNISSGAYTKTAEELLYELVDQEIKEDSSQRLEEDAMDM